LTYGHLDARANALARRLQTLGVGPGVRVGVCHDRAAINVVGLLAILATPREEEPQISVPMIDVIVAMPGASPMR